MSQVATPAFSSRRLAAGSGSRSAVSRTCIVIFVIATAMPLNFGIAGAHLNVHRALMLVMIIPLAFAWAAGRAPGKIMFVDILMFIHALWMLIALLSNHSLNEILVYWLSQATETLGPYLLARLVIRDKESFLFFTKSLILMVFFLLPFAMIESLSGNTILVDIFDKIPGTSVPNNVGYGERLGLTRAQVTFEHPILFGVYCAIPFALAIVSLKAEAKISDIGRSLRVIGIGAAVFFSVSSGALAAVVVQSGLIFWDTVLRHVRSRWHVLGGLFAAAYAFVSIVSNRAPLVVLISYVTFSTSTAYNRVLIWRYGTDDVMSNPLFGIGLNDWSRPMWMISSVDNFWLLWAMRYGLVGFLLLAVPIIMILYKVIGRDFSSDEGMAQCRKGYVFSVIGVSTALATVAFWGGAYAMLCFLIGSGVWMMTVQPGAPDAGDPDKAETETDPEPGRYTRFASRDRAAPSHRPRPRLGERRRPGGPVVAERRR